MTDNMKEAIERQRQLTQERGYCEADMEKIQRRIENERREWIRHFDSYIESMLHDNTARNQADVEIIIKTAAALADTRQKEIERRGLLEDLEV